MLLNYMVCQKGWAANEIMDHVKLVILKDLTCRRFSTIVIEHAWICNHINYKVWDENTYPFLNLNGATVEV